MADPTDIDGAPAEIPRIEFNFRDQSETELSKTRLNAEIASLLPQALLQEVAPARGRVVTFYSYKGGVGRSRALANVAVQMARDKKSVVCIDFDLEAPGLDSYLTGEGFVWPAGDPLSKPGLLDFVYSYRDSLFARMPKPCIRTEEIVQIIEPKDGVRIAFIGAGRRDANYKQSVANFDWKSFYEHWDGGVVIDKLKMELTEKFDYVLIDSRTGITDTSGICSVHLPDVLVAVFTPGPQSQSGLVDALQCIEENREALRPQEPLHILPLPCRVDRDVVRESFERWFEQLVSSYLAQKVSVIGWMWSAKEYFQRVSVEHFSRFVYDDTIESLVHDAGDEAGNTWKYRNLIQAIDATAPVRLPRLATERPAAMGYRNYQLNERAR